MPAAVVEQRPLAKDPAHPGKNWITETGDHQLPKFLSFIASGILKGGGAKSTGEAIAKAVGICKRWAMGGKHVTPITRKRAAQAIAEWEARRAEAHGNGKKSLDDDGMETKLLDVEPSDDVPEFAAVVAADSLVPLDIDSEDGYALLFLPDGGLALVDETGMAMLTVEPRDDDDDPAPAVTPADDDIETKDNGMKASQVKTGMTVTVQDKGKTVTGKVTGVGRRGPMVALTMEGQDGQVFVPATASVTVGETKALAYMDGSLEQHQAAIVKAINEAVLPDSDGDSFSGDPDDGGTGAMVTLDATFPDSVYFTVVDPDTPGDWQSYMAPYDVDDDGDVTLGVPQPVDLHLTATPDTDFAEDQDEDEDDDFHGPTAGSTLNPADLGSSLAMTKALFDRIEAKAAAWESAGLETKAAKDTKDDKKKKTVEDMPEGSRMNAVRDRLRQAHGHLTAALGIMGTVPTPEESDPDDAADDAEEAAAAPAGAAQTKDLPISPADFMQAVASAQAVLAGHPERAWSS